MNEQESNQMILDHLWVVKSVASRLKSGVLFSADWDDLISAGNLALVNAGRNYEARNGCQFKTYAYKCVRGAMFLAFTRIDGHHDSGRIQWCELEESSYPAPQEEKVYRDEQQDRLGRLIDGLSERDKPVIEAYVEGRSLVGMARDMGIKRDRLMKWQRTAVKQMVERSLRLERHSSHTQTLQTNP